MTAIVKQRHIFALRFAQVLAKAVNHSLACGGAIGQNPEVELVTVSTNALLEERFHISDVVDATSQGVDG
jgi:hypothetical protein